MTCARLRLVASPALVRADQEPPILWVLEEGIHPACNIIIIIIIIITMHSNHLSGFVELCVQVGAPQAVLLAGGLLVPGPGPVLEQGHGC